MLQILQVVDFSFTVSILTASCIDIERYMEDNLERLKNVLQQMPSALIVVRQDYTIQDWNKCIADKTKIPAEYAIGRKLNLIIPALNDYLGMVKEALRSQSIQNVKHAKIIISADDLHKIFDITVYPVPVINQREAVIIIDDITSGVKSDSELAQIEKLASVGASVAGVAHEINNPLASIIQSAQNIKRRLNPEVDNNRKAAEEIGLDLEKLKKYLQKRSISSFIDNICKEGERASRIVTNMLKFVRNRPNKKTKNNIIDIIEKGIQVAEMEVNLQDDSDFKDIHFSKDFPDKAVIIECDPQEIEQVIINIIRNSAQALATQEARKEINIKVTQQSKSVVKIEIYDNGPGIPEKIIDQVFQPFFTTKSSGKGTGLGLSICYNIINMHHHGSIVIESVENAFSKFTITLPVKYLD